MKDYKQFFKNKKVTVMGLGLLGRGVGDALFLAECGAQLTITDLKTKEQLKESLDKLKKFKNIKYTLGEHKLEDFQNADFILKAAGVPLDSIYIAEARKNKIPIEMSAALFAKYSGVPIVGVTGTRGKSTVTHLIAHILESAGKKIILGGNVRGVSNLQLLKQVDKAELAVFELDSWQLQGFGEMKISPHIAVFTNFLSDHLNYYKNNPKKYFTDKSFIYKFQKKNDILILGPRMKGKAVGTKAKIINASLKGVPKSWQTNLLGKHNIENIACAIETARILKIKDEVVKRAVESFKSIAGRLEMVKKVYGVSIYNDTNSTTPDAAIAALNSFSKKVILIMGGTDKNLELKNLAKNISKHTKALILLPGNGTDRLLKENPKLKNQKAKDLKDAVNKSLDISSSGDIILFSPAFTSFGMFNNEYDRGERFMKIIKKLK